MEHARSGDLVKAARYADEDPALRLYLKTLINRPAYGLRNEISQVSQIFSILGTSGTCQVLGAYLLNLIAPQQWSLFALSPNAFYDLQASLGKRWEKILIHLGLQNNDTQSAVSLLPAAIIVCDALFSAHKNKVNELRGVRALDYNTILYRLSGQSLFDLCSEIARKWELPPLAERIVHASSGLDPDITGDERELAQWLHLLFFYELSQAPYVAAGLNEFLDFQIDFAQEIYPSFIQTVGYDESDR